MNIKTVASALALTFVAAVSLGAYQGIAAAEPVVKTVTVIQEVAPYNGATYVPVKNDAFNQGIEVGIDFWMGRLGTLPDMLIHRVAEDPCGGGTNGCAWQYAPGKCSVFIPKHMLQDNNRWGLQAVMLHEVGHCFGQAHDDTDLVMHS